MAQRRVALSKFGVLYFATCGVLAAITVVRWNWFSVGALFVLTFPASVAAYYPLYLIAMVVLWFGLGATVVEGVVAVVSWMLVAVANWVLVSELRRVLARRSRAG